MPNRTNQRRGAVIPLFALLLPVLMIFCAMAINLAYMQLANTEMQVAIDVSVHAGGRRLGTPVANSDGSLQTLAEAKAGVMDFAAEIAAMNTVTGSSAIIPKSAMEFGRSSRALKDNGKFAAYQFQPVSDNQIPSSFRITSKDLELRHPFGPFGSANGFRPSATFTVHASSVSTQVDRDVVLVLDRSGSMLYFEDEDLLNDTIKDILAETYTEPGEIIWEFRVQWRRGGGWNNSIHGPYMTEAEFDEYPDFPSHNEYRLDPGNKNKRSETFDMVIDKITQQEHDHALNGRPRYNNDYPHNLYERWYSNNLIYWLEVSESLNGTWYHTLGDDPKKWTDGLTIEQQRAELQGHMAQYAHDYRYRYRLNDFTITGSEDLGSRKAPDFSRWYHLKQGLSVFLNVLGGGVDPDGTKRDGTVQKEQIAILPFNKVPNNQTDSSYHNPDFDYELQDDGFPSAFVNDSSDPGYAVPFGDSTVSLREVLDTIVPYDATAIGDSLREAVHIIRSRTDTDLNARARPFAAKTIVVLTDGDNTAGDAPDTVAEEEIANENVLVHTITFTPGVSTSGRTAMAAVARYGKGKHYHTDSGEQLSTIFEQIANNLPTIVTE